MTNGKRRAGVYRNVLDRIFSNMAIKKRTGRIGSLSYTGKGISLRLLWASMLAWVLHRYFQGLPCNDFPVGLLQLAMFWGICSVASGPYILFPAKILCDVAVSRRFILFARLLTESICLWIFFSLPMPCYLLPTFTYNLLAYHYTCANGNRDQSWL